MMQLMKELSEKKGQTFVVVTHDSHIAETAHSIIHLKDGLIDGMEDGWEYVTSEYVDGSKIFRSESELSIQTPWKTESFSQILSKTDVG